MFSKFKLNDIIYSDFKEYESSGQEYYAKIQTDIQSSLSMKGKWSFSSRKMN